MNETAIVNISWYFEICSSNIAEELGELFRNRYEFNNRYDYVKYEITMIMTNSSFSLHDMLLDHRHDRTKPANAKARMTIAQWALNSRDPHFITSVHHIDKKS